MKITRTCIYIIHHISVVHDMKEHNNTCAMEVCRTSLILSGIANPVKSALPHEGNLKGMDAPLVVIHESAANEFQNRKHFQTCSSTSIATIVLANNSSTLDYAPWLLYRAF